MTGANGVVELGAVLAFAPAFGGLMDPFSRSTETIHVSGHVGAPFLWIDPIKCHNDGGHPRIVPLELFGTFAYWAQHRPRRDLGVVRRELRHLMPFESSGPQPYFHDRLHWGRGAKSRYLQGHLLQERRIINSAAFASPWRGHHLVLRSVHRGKYGPAASWREASPPLVLKASWIL